MRKKVSQCKDSVFINVAEYGFLLDISNPIVISFSPVGGVCDLVVVLFKS